MVKGTTEPINISMECALIRGTLRTHENHRIEKGLCPMTCTDIYTVDTAGQLLVLENNTQTLYFAKYKNQEFCDVLLIFRLKWIT